MLCRTFKGLITLLGGSSILVAMANDAYGLLEAAAVHHGESLAIVDGDKLMTYHELQMRVINPAQWLVGQWFFRANGIAAS